MASDGVIVLPHVQLGGVLERPGAEDALDVALAEESLGELDGDGAALEAAGVGLDQNGHQHAALKDVPVAPPTAPPTVHLQQQRRHHNNNDDSNNNNNNNNLGVSFLYETKAQVVLDGSLRSDR